jgi:hypothetical protein
MRHMRCGRQRAHLKKRVERFADAGKDGLRSVRQSSDIMISFGFCWSEHMSGYWDLVAPVWHEINIYDGPEIFLETFSKAPIRSGLLFAAHFCQSEVCNGGFDQFFFNSAGVLAPEAVRGFRAIGQNQVANLVESAMQRLGREYERDRELRQGLLEGCEDMGFDDLDQQFFRLVEEEAGGFETAADTYAALTVQ